MASISKELKQKLAKMENKWDRNFYVTASKNNETVHTDYKEYFDRPLAYDIKSDYHGTLPKPMMVYEKRDGSPATSRIIVNKKKIKELQKRAETERKKVTKVNLQKQLEMVNPHKFTEYGYGSNQMFATFLRISNQMKLDKIARKKERRWNQRFAIPISQYNESRHRNYKLMFDQI